MKDWPKQHTVHLVVTIGALLIAAAHLLWPAFQVDYATLALLIIALLPWLGSIFKTIELPGGGKVEYRDFERAEEDAVEAGLLKPKAQRQPDKPAYAAVAEEDPNLALAACGLRLNAFFARWPRLTDSTQAVKG